MQSEEFDNKIRGAAENHHPLYDEKAWDKMEVLLDKHLPQEEKKRRGFIFFLLLFLLLGTGAFLIVAKPWKEGNKQLAIGNGQPEGENSEQAKDNRQLTIDNEQPLVDNKESTIVQQGTGEKITGSNINTGGVSGISISASLIKKNSNHVAELLTGKSKKTNASIADKLVRTQDNSIIDKFTDNDKKQNPFTGSYNDLLSKNIISTDKETIQTEKLSDVKKQEDKIEEAETDKEISKNTKAGNKRLKNKKTNSIFFTFSAGPDISFAGSDKAGKTKLLTGLGMGYSFGNHFSIRTGFYSSRKIYGASPAAYHPPASFYIYYPHLQKVEADCKVYEIPVSLSYQFGKSEKQNWFVSTGLSSYLMKKESYDYYYKYTAYGQTVKSNWTIKNENNHYFSVLNLSAGYKRQLSKSISIMAEPYLKIPLTGVGYGNVKLNSTGVLFSIAVKPFAARK